MLLKEAQSTETQYQASVDEYDSALRHGAIPDLLPYLEILPALGCSYPGLSDARRCSICRVYTEHITRVWGRKLKGQVIK